MLFYDWVDGELVRNALGRVRGLPVGEVVGLLGEVYDLHVEIAGLGWIANDFYDGSMIYDFERRRLYAVDLDTYHPGPFVNDMGRMFGSRRFMAPEEFELGAIIDERTTVFTMGRTAAVMLSDGSLDRKPFRGNDAQYEIMVRACRERPDDRFPERRGVARRLAGGGFCRIERNDFMNIGFIGLGTMGGSMALNRDTRRASACRSRYTAGVGYAAPGDGRGVGGYAA